MSITCTDIETLVHSYLDGELADDDVDALHEHVAECSTCNESVAEEQQFHSELREKLAPPEPPAELHDRILTALDREDWNARKDKRSGLSWSLPAAASLAAVAALFLFVFTSVNNAPPQEDSYSEAVERHIRRQPIEVQGQQVSTWIEQHSPLRVAPPRFPDRNTSLHGVRLSHLFGRDALQLYYEASLEHRRYHITALISDTSGIDFPTGRQHRIAGRVLHVGEVNGYNIVAFKDAREIGYFFVSEMSADDLVQIVANSDLLLRAPDGAR